MSATLRNLLAVLIAMLVGGVIVYLTETLGARVAPPPGSLDVTDPEQIKAALEAGEVPFVNLFLVAAGWFLGAYAGGTTAWRLSRTGWPVWAFALIFTVAILSTLMAFPHPTWMWVAGLAGAPLVALGAGNRSLQVST